MLASKAAIYSGAAPGAIDKAGMGPGPTAPNGCKKSLRILHASPGLPVWVLFRDRAIFSIDKALRRDACKRWDWRWVARAGTGLGLLRARCKSGIRERGLKADLWLGKSLRFWLRGYLRPYFCCISVHQTLTNLQDFSSLNLFLYGFPISFRASFFRSRSVLSGISFNPEEVLQPLCPFCGHGSSVSGGSNWKQANIISGDQNGISGQKRLRITKDAPSEFAAHVKDGRRANMNKCCGVTQGTESVRSRTKNRSRIYKLASIEIQTQLFRIQHGHARGVTSLSAPD